jgi:FMN-dependent oxidoreductase (nitrilotriacetate monooxygenase family)
MKRQIHLGAFLYPTGYHVAAWRHPDVPADAGINFDHFTQLARSAERGQMDFLFLADSLAMRGRDLPALSRAAIRYVAQFEPLTLLSALSVVTERIGLVASASTTYNEPFHVARNFASIDHISAGRVGWNLVTSQNEDEANNFGLNEHPAHGRRYQRAEEFAEVVKGLWDSWEDDAFVRDKETGLFFDPAKVHPLNHSGKHFSVRGPLNIPRSPQGYPVLVQSGSSEAGKELAARTAEVVFTAQSNMREAIAFYADLKDRLARHGRTADELKVFVGVFPYVGRSREEVEFKIASLHALIDPVVGLSMLGTQLSGIDLSDYPLDGPLPEIPSTNAGQGRRELLIQMARRENLTIRQLYERVAASRGHWTISGTAKEIADEIQTWWSEGAADGFIVMAPALPDGLESFVSLVIPELQRRGIFRNHYTASTLRGHLGLRRPLHPTNIRSELACATEQSDLAAPNMPDEAVEPVALRAEFDAMLARSDLCVIPDRLEGTLSNYAELRRLTGILHMFNPLLNPESEPAHVFRLSSLLRKP